MLFRAGIVLLLLISFSKESEQCTERFMELALVTYRAQRIGTTNLPEYYAGNNTLRVLQEYQFNCSSTNIASLILGINIREVSKSGTFYPSVQVFRRIGASLNYNLVTERTIYYSTSNVSTSGVFEYPLNPPIPVMSGDLLAVSQPELEASVVRIYSISGISFNSIPNISIGSLPINLKSSPTTHELILVYPVTDGYCVNSANSITASFIKEKALEVQRSQPFYRKSQFIYPWIVFSCNGSVTKWIFGANNKGNTAIQSELQIWRQLGPNNYNKIGSSLVNANTMIDTNLYEFIPQTPLQFQEGDIFGVYSDRTDEERLVLYEQRESGPTNLRINTSLDSPPSTISEILRTVNNDFPLVTVEINISTVSTQVAFTSSTTKSTPTDYSTLSYSPFNSPYITYSYHFQSDFLTQSTSILSTSPTISSSLSQSSATPIATSVVSSTRNTSIATRSSSMSSVLTTTPIPSMTDTSVSLSSSDSVIQNTGNSNGSMTIIIAITASAFVLIVLGLIAMTLIVVTCRAKRKKRESYSMSSKEDHNFHNPTYEMSSVVTSNRQIHATNPVYEVTNELKTGEVNAELYGDNDAEAIYSEADNTNFETQGDTSIEGTYSVVKKEFFVPSAHERKQTCCSTDEDIYSSLADTQNVYSMVEDKTRFFVEDPIYWEPGTDTNDIYQQLSDKRYREIPRKQIKITGHLGSGQFGSVSKGVWESPTGPVDVAIKTLNNNTSEDEKVKFLQEAAIMGQFHHPNIVRLHGMVTVGEPLMIVLELIPHGDMRQYLHTLQPQPGELVASTVPGLLLSFCRQIASGMEYLSKKGFVHRDLAARNILIADKEVCKISDFGMSRDLQNENYYLSSGGQIPIKWTAPEALHYKKYSSASDVWSYGALLYEIWSLGYKPFHDMTNQQAIRKIESGVRLSPPPGCPREVYKIMMQCWHPERDHRPTFAILVSSFSQSDSSLISWYPIDTECHPLAGVLGAPLEAGHHMFTDLQSMYL